MSETTQTGIPIIDCEICGYRHPSHTQHCITCGKPSRFIFDGVCIGCAPVEPPKESLW